MTRILTLCLLLVAVASCANPELTKPLPPYNATNASNAGEP